MTETLHLIDGSGYLFRAYHGLRGRALAWLTGKAPALRPLHGWDVPETSGGTVPAQRPGGNFEQM